ncbi:hypothetical protein CTRI78_v004972 [Colletotrichum trifolii]|uniref:Uncharacterized protein n=1 Tax=Colletotrichum trifolii TaxID=5466 RepID=A0A4R8RFN4_COLTR|nr:hypothetical protein CTRI78_v004972 [Colletotrichum trifolii]
MSILDPNTWYRLSETRVDNSTGPFNLNLQLRDVGLRVHPVSDGTASWQFLPVGDVKGRYLMRLEQAGVKQQLGVCYDSAEIASGNTVACLQASALDASQQWDVSSFGAGTFKFVNVANGTKYVLDVHPSSNLFLSTAIEGSPGVADKQPAQHWVLSSASAVNDAAYSTIYSGDVPISTYSSAQSSTSSSTSTTTTSSIRTTRPAMATTTADATASASSTATTTAAAAKPSSNISTAAGAGIGVAVALSVVGLIGAVAFFFWRRSQSPAKPKYSEVEAKHGEGPAPGRVSSVGVSPSHESAPSSLHGVSPTVGVSTLSHWQPPSSVNVPPTSSFMGQQSVSPANVPQNGYFPNMQQPGVQQHGYYVEQQQHQQQNVYYAENQHHTNVQQAGYYAGGQQPTMPEQPTTYLPPQNETFASGEQPVASLYGQRIATTPSPQLPTASLYGQRVPPTTNAQANPTNYPQQTRNLNTTATATSSVPRHQFDHPGTPNEFAPGASTPAEPVPRTTLNFGTTPSQASSTVNLADFEPMPQPHEIEAAERDIVRRQHELGTFHHGPQSFEDEQRKREQASKMLATPQAELSAYQHGPDTFAGNEAKTLGVPTAELGAYQHGPDTFENEHEDKVLGSFHPGTEPVTREREDKVLGNFHEFMNLKSGGRGGSQNDATGPQEYEMGPMRPPAR